jgi:small-conductance mechanosensitive channel
VIEPTPLAGDLGGLTDGPVFDQLVATLVLAALLASAKALAVRLLGRMGSLRRRSRRRWLVRIRNSAVLLFAVGVVMIWFEQMIQVATALALVATGFVIATRQLWLNLSGYFFRSGAHFFAVGDRIEIGDFRGDVVDHGLAGATLLELGAKSQQYTGRAVFVPNSKFLSSAVTNETFMADYVFHTLTIPMKAEEDWDSAEKALLRAAREICDPYVEKARSHLKKMSERHSLDVPSVEPKVHILLPEPGNINLMLRVPIPARRKGRIEQAIIRRYLELLKDAEPAVAEPTPAPEAEQTVCHA